MTKRNGSIRLTVLVGLVIMLAGATALAQVGPGPFPGQRLNRSGSGMCCDADCDTGWEFGDSDDTATFEINQTAEVAVATGEWVFKDNVDTKWGTGEDAACGYDTAVTPDTMVCTAGTDSRVWIFADKADAGTDWAKAQQTNTTVCVQSADQTSVTDRICLAHDQTDAVITSEAGGLGITTQTLTSGGTDDHGVEINTTLNDTGAAGGTDVYRGLKVNVTSTDVTGWDNVYMIDALDDATSVFNVTQAGAGYFASSVAVVSQTIGIDFASMRVFDNPAALLPAAGAADDLGFVIGTPGTNAASLQTEDLKAEGGNPTLNKAMFYWVVPASYSAGATVNIVANAGMITTIADDAVTLDLTCWVPDYANADGTVSSDLIGTAAQSINSLTFADKTFVLDDDVSGHVLAAGSVVQCIAITSTSDGATGTAVIAAIRKIDVVIST